VVVLGQYPSAGGVRAHEDAHDPPRTLARPTLPGFFVIFGIFIASGASISNALRCPTCGLHQFYNDGVERDFHFCPKCGADFNAPLPPPSQGDSAAGR
jgi:hypothetical protein